MSLWYAMTVRAILQVIALLQRWADYRRRLRHESLMAAVERSISEADAVFCHPAAPVAQNILTDG